MKEDDVSRFFSTNINSVSFWQHNNYKVDWLKFLLKQYNIDSIGLQEGCINWSAFKSSETLSSLL